MLDTPPQDKLYKYLHAWVKSCIMMTMGGSKMCKTEYDLKAIMYPVYDTATITTQWCRQTHASVQMPPPPPPPPHTHTLNMDLIEVRLNSQLSRYNAPGFTQYTFNTHPIICLEHYSDIIMGAMAFQITSFNIVYVNRLFGSRSKKTSKFPASLTGEFPAQMASNAENVSIWWRHHDLGVWSMVYIHRPCAIWNIVSCLNV